MEADAPQQAQAITTAVPYTETLRERAKIAMTQARERLETAAELLQLLEGNPDFERILNLAAKAGVIG